MTYITYVLKNIENFYSNYRKELLENDTLRPCKSITRDVFATLDKFKSYYEANNSHQISQDTIMRSVFNTSEMNDVITTNIRVMREFGFLRDIGVSEYSFTDRWDRYVADDVDSKEYFLQRFLEIKQLSDFNMIYNTLLCALREGYTNGYILSFPESKDEFHRLVPDKEKRLDYCRMVYDIYGFHGRNRGVESDSYTPNSSYRILTVLRKLDLIQQIQNVDGMNAYALTEKALDVLVKINQSLGKAPDDALSHDFYGMHITRKNSAITNGEICIGWSGLGDLSEVASKEQLADLMDTAYPDKKPRSKAQDISQIWTFKDGMSIGDYVVFSDGVNAYIGVIKSDYYYEVDGDARDIDYVNNRKVEWLKTIAREDLPKVFRNALASARSVFSLNAYKSIILELLEKGVVDIDDDDNDIIEEDDDMEEVRPYIELNFTTNIDCDFERNRIVFGAPGTGKSFQMEEDRAKLVEMGGGYERVTFHPDYTYSSFVGCYKPVSEKGKIEYKYVPGPFMRVLVEALRSGLTDNPKPYLLVIEEINRAKVAAVFGEVFQLLDRDSKGTSDYEIHTSEDVKKYLSDELNGSLESFARIRIPNNMFIWASMNSADQGVFPMDTAFKRRWSFEYKGIDENEDKVGGLITLGEGEHEFEVNWNVLRKAINEVLAKKFNINEDKLMGPFFMSEDVFAFDEKGYIKNPAKFKRVFKSKVIMYLYEDAAKQQKHKLFAGCDSTKYSSICDAFDKIGIDIFGADFKDTYKDME